MPSHLRAGTPLAYLLAGLAILGGVVFLATPTPGPAMIVVLVKVLTAAWPAAAYLAGAAGLGRLARPLYAGVKDEPLVQAGVGLALMLTVSHLLGQAGLVRGTAGLVAAWAPVAAGIGVLGWQMSRAFKGGLGGGLGGGKGEDRPWGMLDWAPVMVAAAVLVVASCNPPGGMTGLDYGGLWSSEFGGFDALSYHLPLPQEWLAAGRLAPVPHNVYSFLPGYMEAAFLHVSVLSGAGNAAGGLLADEGWRLLTCQMLHAGMAGLTAWGCVRLVRAFGPGGEAGGVGERLAACLAVATPWTVVVGSLAYNELAVTALSAPLLLVAADDRLAGWRRGVVVGVLLAAASSVKPPAAFLLGVPAAVFLFGRTANRAWVGVVVGGVVAGLLVMAPWLVRNWQACGNPVFPEAHGLFGMGGWSEGQFERYAAEHHESAPLWAKVVMMFVRPEGSAQHRGVLHPQWALFFPAVVVLGVMALRGVEAGIKRTAVRLGLGLAGGVAAWLLLTHVQSRFLVPLLVPGAVLAGLGVLALPAGVRRGVGVVLGLGQALALVVVFAGQYGGQPGVALAWMPSDAAGESYGRALKNAGSAERLEFFTKRATPQEYINLGLPPGSVVYLLGDATPLYCTGKVVYNTVWDRWPILEAAEADPGAVETQAGVWLATLRKRGITHVLLNIPEVARYRASGYSDPRLTVEFVASVLIGRARVERQWPADRAVSPTHILFSLSGASTGLARGDQ